MSDNKANRFRFRAWDAGRKEMIYDAQLKYGHEYWFGERSDRLMQSTGLLDRNQKEIYEDDILSSDEYVINPANHVAVVGWKNGSFGFDIIALSELLRTDGLIDSIVIGNCYEHPELLK